MKTVTTCLIALLFLFNLITTGAFAATPSNAKAPPKELSLAACRIVWAYYSGDEAEMDKLLEKYGDPEIYNKERIDLLHLEMTHISPASAIVERFQCESDLMLTMEDNAWMIVVRGTLEQTWGEHVRYIAMTWDCYITAAGKFSRIVIDAAMFDPPAPVKKKKKRL